jgi:tetratricopeptide (TPR) repeat protein
MSVHLDRARLLLAQSRPADAEREALQALMQQPDNPEVHTLLALSRIDQRKIAEAIAAAEHAVGLAPASPFPHYVHALVLHRAERDSEAEVAVAEAIRLDPLDADHFALRSSIALARRNWPAALSAAEEALALQPEHVGAANLRSMALVRLGRKTEAMEAVDFALRRAPDNAFSHANQGWNCLHRNDPRQAQEHFREALRLEPDLAYAREGMLEALKARNPIYRGMLAYFLWIGRQRRKFQWAFVAVTLVISRGIGHILAAPGSVAWPVVALIVLFYTFIYLSWTAQPMFNLLLRFDRFGRFVLSRDERHATWWFGASLAPALGCLIWWPLGGGIVAVLAAAIFAILSVCASATFIRTKQARKILAAYSGALAVVGLAGLWAILTKREDDGGMLALFGWGFLGFQLLANFLPNRG